MMAGDPEKAPLLINGTAVASAVGKEPRQFKGPWWHVLGDFGAADVSATCLAWNAPWVAYGWNAQRGLGLSWWKEALKLLLLTCGVFALVRLVLVVLVETQCHDLPRMHPHDMDHHHGPWHHMMHHHGHGGPHDHPVDPAAVATAKAAVAAAAVAATTTASSAANTANVADVATQTAAAAVDDKDEREERPERHGPHHHLRDQDDEDDDDDDEGFPELTPEEHEALRHCALRVGPWAVVLVSVGITALVYAAYLAALRRRMMRERFGIEGSFRNDLLLWLGCAPCALAQETRTLMFNNVEEGLWHGPLQVLTAPRQAQPMAA